MAYCTGYTGLGEGQYLDLTYENKKVNKEKIIIMQKKKTGKLFGFCFECIAIIKGFNLIIQLPVACIPGLPHLPRLA